MTSSGDAWSPPPEGAQYGIASGANATAQYTLSVGDRFVLSAVRPPAEVGVYTATYALVDLAARFAPGLVITVVRPRIFRAWDVGRTEDHGPLVGRLAAMRQGRLAGHGLVAAAVCLALNVLLVPGLGPAGAALATAGSYAVLLVLNAGGLDATRLFGRHALSTVVAALGSLGALSVGSAVGGPIPGIALSSVGLLLGAPAAVRVLAAIRASGVESGGRPLGPPVAPSDGEQDAQREP